MPPPLLRGGGGWRAAISGRQECISESVSLTDAGQWIQGRSCNPARIPRARDRVFWLNVWPVLPAGWGRANPLPCMHTPRRPLKAPSEALANCVRFSSPADRSHLWVSASAPGHFTTAEHRICPFINRPTPRSRSGNPLARCALVYYIILIIR